MNSNSAQDILITDKINILVTFDKNYIKPFRVMLASLVINNSQEKFHIWLLHSAIPQEDLDNLLEYCKTWGVELSAIEVERSVFENAVVSKQYPQEMYYRLLATLLLPKDLDKVLYLDPDILVINSVRPLWERQLGEFTFAAASHRRVIKAIDKINQIRLENEHDYFNTGVILMDLNKARQLVKADDVYDCVRKRSKTLILPDQDVFNVLYGKYTLNVPDNIWNYDARRFLIYLGISDGVFDMNWVMQNTVFLHFCGKQKPWKAKYYTEHYNQFSALYKHYMKLAEK